jgi:molybdopterin converting factor small subunit
MKIQVIIFGQLAEITGKSLTATNITDTNELVKYLHKNFPALEKVKYKIAVDKKLVNQNTLLTENCEVALLPPFSGG